VPLSDSLHSAWSSETGCPPAEDWLRLQTGDVTADERRSLEAHAARCPACAAERDLARLFAEAPETAQGEDVEYVVGKLESLKLQEQPVPLAFPGRRRPVLAWAARLAALIVLAVGVALFFRAGQAPPLRDPGAGDVYRGGEVRVVGPVGEISQVPREFRWEAAEGARSYRVILRAVDDTVLWQETVTAPSARLPEDIVQGLHPAVVYRWNVEALDERGARLAASEPVQFMVR
jgi:hypothetical protein